MSSDERKIAERMLMNELKELQKENWVDVEVGCVGASCIIYSRLNVADAISTQPRDGNLFLWDVALIVVNPTSLYSGAYLKVCSSRLCVVATEFTDSLGFLGRTQDPEKLSHEPARVSFYTSPLPPKHLHRRETVHFDSPCTRGG